MYNQSNSWENFCYTHTFIFPIIVDSDFKEINRIHPLKQKAVTAIHDALRDDADVKQAIVFGSSTSLKCNPQSDIDLYISIDSPSNEKMNRVLDKIDSAEGLTYRYDVIWGHRLNKTDKICQKIKRGVALK